LLVAAVFALLPAAPAHAQAGPDAVMQIDIAPGPLEPALRKLAGERNLQILFAPEDVKGVTTAGAKGRFTARAAIEELLKGTGLTVSSNANDVYAIKPAPGRARTSEGQPADTTTLVVVGTRIPNTAPTSPVITIGREDIERSGATTTQGVLAEVPQNFSGVNAASSRLSGGNTGLTSQIDLHGLGSEATLVLINGRRVSGGAGDQGRAVDIDMIPLSAIDRIDILTDGASALYGSDAIGGVVNIVLRRDFDGAQAAAQYGWNAAGADKQFASFLFGKPWATGNFLAAVQYQRTDPLKAAEVGITSVDFRSRGGGDFRLSPYASPGTVLPVGIFDGNPFTTITAPGGGPVFTAALPPGNGRNVRLQDLRLNESNSADLVSEDLAPRQESASAYFTFEQDLGPVTIFADGAASRRKAINRTVNLINLVFVPTTNAFTPFAEDVLVAYEFREPGPTEFRVENSGWFANLGARGSLPVKNWTWELVGTASRDESERLFSSIDFGALDSLLASSNPAAAFNPFGNGTGQPAGLVIPMIDQGFKAETKLHAATLNIQGELWEMPAGKARFAAGVEYRSEKLDGRGTGAATGQVLFDNSSRDLSSIFGEAYIPVVRDVALSLAARHDQYSDFGDTTNPKVGILWRPTTALDLRANWGSSFRAPLLRELSQLSQTLPHIQVVDPLKPGGAGPVFIDLVVGGNPNLEPETADTYTISGAYRPLPGAKLAASYFHTDYKHRIRGLLDGLSVGTLLSFQEALPPGIAVRDASGNLTALNVTNINSARTLMSGMDLSAEYGWKWADYGSFLARAGGTVILKNDDRLIAGAPVLDLKGRVGNPAKWRGRLDLTWSRMPWDASVTVHHTDGLINDDPDTRIVQHTVSGQTTVDAQVTFKLRSGPAWMRGLTAQLGATNIFDKHSPFVDGENNYGVDPRNFNIEGRTVFVRLSMEFGAAAR
jgi:outer membrane receptor protein involved in Fe transport